MQLRPIYRPIRQSGSHEFARHGRMTCRIRRPCVASVVYAGLLLYGNVAYTPCRFGNWTTRGYANSRIANSRTGHLADWSSRGLNNSRTSQLVYWTSRVLDNSRSRRCRQKGKLSTQSRRWHPRVAQSATCPVRELAIRDCCPVTVASHLTELQSCLQVFARSTRWRSVR